MATIKGLKTARSTCMRTCTRNICWSCTCMCYQHSFTWKFL